MAIPTNVTFTPSTTVISSAWTQGVNDWVYGAYGVLGSTYTATAFRTALGVPALAGGNTFTGTQAMGAVTATTFNGHTLTAGSSTFTGTAGQTYTFPTTTATLARTDAAQTFTGAQTFSTAIAVASGGTGVSSAPKFSSYQSVLQSIPNAASPTRVLLQSEEYDIGGFFDSATNYRFQPTVAGYYQISGAVRYAAVGTNIYVAIGKNGTLHKSGAILTSGLSATVSSLVYLNGSTDYIDLLTYQASGGALDTTALIDQTYLNGCFISK